MLARTHFKLNIVELRKRSHLLVRLMPGNISDSTMTQVHDFVELCGSDMAANTVNNTMASERERIFAT